MIKVCINPHCEEVAHNCDKKETRCRNCGFRLIEINEITYKEKFIHGYPHQIDYSTGERTTPKEQGFDIQLKMF